ncbi:MAG TPA: fluoride efflux transporter CrcB [Actinomycetota bacterium]|nr:fluoride efflux transporter CrcB [Actinomycetota bacterium]
MRSLWIGAAGFLGAVSRYQVEGLIGRRWPGAFPWGTLTVNLTGCFILGFTFTILTERFVPHPNLRSAITIGFLGAYTTFSTFAFETLRLGQAGALGMAALNVAVSVVAGLAAAWGGIVVGRAI